MPAGRCRCRPCRHRRACPPGQRATTAGAAGTRVGGPWLRLRAGGVPVGPLPPPGGRGHDWGTGPTLLLPAAGGETGCGRSRGHAGPQGPPCAGVAGRGRRAPRWGGPCPWVEEAGWHTHDGRGRVGELGAWTLAPLHPGLGASRGFQLLAWSSKQSGHLPCSALGRQRPAVCACRRGRCEGGGPGWKLLLAMGGWAPGWRRCVSRQGAAGSPPPCPGLRGVSHCRSHLCGAQALATRCGRDGGVGGVGRAGASSTLGRQLATSERVWTSLPGYPGPGPRVGPHCLVHQHQLGVSFWR